MQDISFSIYTVMCTQAQCPEEIVVDLWSVRTMTHSSECMWICRLIAKLNHDRESVYHLQVILSPVSLTFKPYWCQNTAIERTGAVWTQDIHVMPIHSENKTQTCALIGDCTQVLLRLVLTFYNCFIKISHVCTHFKLG